MTSGEIKYPSEFKQWRSALRKYKGDNYNCLQVPGRVNSRNPTEIRKSIYLPRHWKKEIAQDKTDNEIGPIQSLLDVGLKYGSVRIFYHKGFAYNDVWKTKYTVLIAVATVRRASYKT